MWLATASRIAARSVGASSPPASASSAWSARVATASTRSSSWASSPRRSTRTISASRRGPGRALAPEAVGATYQRVAEGLGQGGRAGRDELLHVERVALAAGVEAVEERGG